MSKFNAKKPVVRSVPTKASGVPVKAKPVSHQHRVVTTTASHVNRSAKYRRPHPQDVHPAGRNQYQA